MAPRNLDEQLTKYLTDIHSIERQALVQMKAAPKIIEDEQIAQAFETHLLETQDHERLVAERLEARGGEPSMVKDVAGEATGAGFAMFAALQPDSTGKLLVHAYSYEHMEKAAYELLGQVSELAGDTATIDVAREIEQQEDAMAQRVAAHFDRAVDASLRDLDSEDLQTQLDKYLADAHAIEMQAEQLLSKGPELAGSAELASAYDEHLSQTREHRSLIDARLGARDASPSRVKDAVLRLGALNWGAFFAAQPDTPAKLAAFSYAFEHLEIASYEMLTRVAERAGDQATVQVAQRILIDERSAADRLRSLFTVALEAALDEQGVGVR